jgi:hypothetical protein
MQAGFNGKRIVLAAVIISVATHVGASANAETAKQALEKTRVELRAQGFKTDLTNFNFATSAESQACEAILGATAPHRNSTRRTFQPPFTRCCRRTCKDGHYRFLAMPVQSPNETSSLRAVITP